jgi:hypothetical protein
MTPAELLKAVRARGIEITTDGAKLHLAPATAVDSVLRAELLRHKRAIIEMLRGPALAPDGGPAAQCGHCGCPTWWRGIDATWHCDHCEPRADQACKVFVVAGGAWGKQ